MLKNCHKVIGVMSGTSLDGIDLVACDFKFDTTWRFHITDAETVPYPETWVEKLQTLSQLSTEELTNIDKDYTKFLADVINAFIAKHNLYDVDFVSSHGHTAKHVPEKGITYQIGNRKELAEYLSQKVVCDFRIQDVELGGQGAPLVPIGDQLLFNDFEYCLNLGGFSNISFENNEERVAYDICPVNMVLNAYAQQLGKAYDNEGRLASIGQVQHDLLEQLNNLPYYKQSWPKSLGKEWVDDVIFPLLNNYQVKPTDILRTLVEHIAVQLSDNIQSESKVLVSGGGAHNKFLMSRLSKMSNAHVVIPKKDIVDYKEAVIFGFLGVLRIENSVNCLKSVTGASIDHCSGKIFKPKKGIND